MRPEPKAPPRTAVGQHWVVVFDVDRRRLASLAGAVPRQAAFIVFRCIFGGLLSGRLVSLAFDGGIAV
jgi:hypothetical protein